MALLSPGGFLAPLIGLTTRRVAGLELDVHLRVSDEVHVYCGLTRVLKAKKATGASVRVWAHSTYRKQPCAKALFRSWNSDARTAFEAALDAYVREVKVRKRHTRREGVVQARWSRIREPWVPFDREAVLRYDPGEEPTFERVDFARSELSGRWAKLPKPGKEVDQLAVDPEGRLVVIELKDASATSDKVYYAPFQLLHYVWQWHCALKHVRGDVQQLIDARVELGMTPRSIPPLTGGIRPIVGFGPDCRSDEVKRRYCDVLDVVNRYLPPGVPSIETWAFEDGSAPPQRVDC